MTVYAITDTKKGEQGLRLLIFLLPPIVFHCLYLSVFITCFVLFFLFLCSFLPCDAMHKRGLCCHAVSVCLSVRESVTSVDHVKTNKHIFEIFSPSGSDTIIVFPYQRGCRHSDGNPPNRGIECKGYDKMRIISQISRSISQMVIGRWAHAARQFVSIEFSFHPYNI